MQYGTYRDGVGMDGSAPWTTGGPSDTIALKFYTADTTFLRTGGSNSTDVGKANPTVVPEPSTLLLGVVALLAVMGSTRRRQRITAD